MNSQEYKKRICRICLDENVILDWNLQLFEKGNITYKDCYYKYTQLDYLDTDIFSSMLCQECLNGLENMHSLILKALESYKYFQETLLFSNQIENHSTNIEDDIKYTPTEFETILVEKNEEEPLIQDHFVYDNSDEEFLEEPIKTSIIQTEKQDKTIKIENKYDENLVDSIVGIEEDKTEQTLKTSSKKSRRKAAGKRKSTKRKTTTEKDKACKLENKEQREIDKSDASLKCHDEQSEVPKVKKKYKEIKKPRMCSICSKILHNKYAVQMHEKTHIENRERKETCKVCGLKFFDKRNLYSHIRIHKENREKIHKCEFCNKAFYDKGGLNIHRRIHLGQMIPCSLCSKQYFRQIDLDRHMSSHSATTINSDTKKRSRYFVRCEHCDKSILSTSFKSHTAAHLNEPLMKCSICSKEFFRRGSCVLHVKKVHQKTNEEYNDFIIQYKKNRISHLFLEQKADIQPTE
ncbi:uncharacterized protein ACRADG_008449 [Cochliomyia hominivorax]